MKQEGEEHDDLLRCFPALLFYEVVNTKNITRQGDLVFNPFVPLSHIT